MKPNWVTISLGILVFLIIFSGCVGPGKPPQGPLLLSDIPTAFSDNLLIVTGDTATPLELQSAMDLKEYITPFIRRPPLMKSYSVVSESERSEFNIIVIGTPRSNRAIGELARISGIVQVNESFPGSGKGVLMILNSPWNGDRALLVVEGFDEQGVMAGSELLTRGEGVSRIRLPVTVAEQNDVKIAEDFVSEYPVMLYTSTISDHRVVRDALEIPFQEGDIKNPVIFRDMVESPRTIPSDHATTVTLFTWTGFGGILTEWQVVVQDNLVTHVSGRVVDTHVGHFTPTPMEGFIPGPGIVLVDEKV
jgi:hypothetical protein